jgi:hypothetical protein
MRLSLLDEVSAHDLVSGSDLKVLYRQQRACVNFVKPEHAGGTL